MYFFKDKQQKMSFFQSAEKKDGNQGVRILDRNIKEQIRLLDLTDDDLHSMVCLKPIITENVPRIASAFYGVIEQNRELMEIVEKYSSIEKLKLTLADFIGDMFSGEIDGRFIEKRRKIAEIHLKIGLEPKWYLLAFGQLQDNLFEILSENLVLPEDFTRAVRAVAKFINFEQQLVLEAYSEQEKSSRRQTEAIKKEMRRQVQSTAATLLDIVRRTNTFVTKINVKTKDLSTGTADRLKVAEHLEQEMLNGKNDFQAQEQLMEQARKSADAMVGKMRFLDETSIKITKIIAIVTDIAQQTHMLALNAAIESARAGEFGRSFAVVAKEVQKLAEATRHSVDDISERIEQMRGQVGELKGYVQNMSEVSVKGSSGMIELNESFDTLLSMMHTNRENSGKTNGELSEEAQVIEELSRAIQQISTSAEDLKQLSERIE